MRSAAEYRRPSFISGSFPADHAPTHNEHRVTGYRTLASLASDSPPRPMRRGAKTRRAPTRRDRPRPRQARRASPRQKPASRVLNPVRSAALFILAAAARRQGPHCSRGSWRRTHRLSPLTARFAAARRERRGAMLRDRSTLLTAHINSVWIRQRSFAI